MENIIDKFKKQLEKVTSSFRDEIKSVRANRPSVGMVEDLRVDYYGSKTPLNHLASIQIKPPREIQIQVYDNEAVKAVSNAIESSNLGLSATVDDNLVRVFIPELSQERREELVKHIKSQVEDYRIQIRNHRDEANKKIDEADEKTEITEDEKFRLKEEAQEETEKTNKEIEEIFNKKKEEIEKR